MSIFLKMAGVKIDYFSAVIYKRQLPSDCKHIEVVLAIIDQYNERIVDCVQPINGLYKIDLINQKAHLDLITKGLKLGRLTIPVTNWIEGMDSPQVRLVVKGLHKDYPAEPIIEALEKLGLQPTSQVDNEKWKDPNTGKELGVRSGNKVVFIKKTDTPIPPTLQVADNQATIWYWGQKLESRNIFSEKTTIEPAKQPLDNLSLSANTLSQSLFSQDNIQKNVINPTQGIENIVIKKPDVPVPRRGRSTSRPGGAHKPGKRSLSRDRMESPSKTYKSSLQDKGHVDTHSTESHHVPISTPAEAAGEGSSAST